MMTVQYIIVACLQSSLCLCHSASYDSISWWPRSSRIHWRRFVKHLSRTFSLFLHSCLDSMIGYQP